MLNVRFVIFRCLYLLPILVILNGCGPVQPTFLSKKYPHEEYREGLKKAGLEESAMARQWLQAADQALRDTVTIVSPFRESAYFPAEQPTALGYRLQARRGERITVSADIASAEPARIFLDLYERKIGDDRIKHVGSATDAPELEFVAGRDREYIIRVQPELLQSAHITLTITSGASLAFPVSGFDSRSIRSFFGDGRDGGKRKHEGVDAFAPRGTPLISVANGTARAANNRLGGKVVWLHDHDNNLNLYYAHLDSQYVGAVRQVMVGDTLGTVGNTGNAKHTPPHLHFGVYARGEGAIDPLPFLNTPLQEPAPITADLQLLEAPARIRAKTADLYVSPSPKAPVLAQLPQHAFVQIVGATADRYRVRYGDLTGYLRAKDVSGVDKAVRKFDLAEQQALLDAPAVSAAPIRELQQGESVELLAVNGAFQKVRTAGEELGWILVE